MDTMTDRARAERRRAARGRGTHGHRPSAAHDWQSVVVGWCATEDDLPEARKGTHDVVIRLLGRARRGGVTWRQLTGDKATAALSSLHEGLDPGDTVMHDHYRHLGAFLREYGGWLVIATAPGDPRVTP